MHQSQSLSEVYHQVCHLIPDYQWTTIIKNDDLTHTLTKTILSCDIDGYYLTVAGILCPMYDLSSGDLVKTTTDVNTAVVAFCVEVIHHLATQILEAI